MHRRHDDFRAFVRLTVKKGANALMRERGFKRPGGGWSFFRPHTRPTVRALTDELSVSATWPQGDMGALELRTCVAVTGAFSLQADTHSLPLDVDGDAGDLAVSINHCLRTEALPWFDERIDFEGLARDAERRLALLWTERRMAECTALWELAGRPDEARRLRERAEALNTF